MAKPIPSHATPVMLKWARESSALSLPDVARAIGISEQTLIDWESGKGSPSIAKLRILAKRYKRPLMVFYLTSPPMGFTVVKDFRTLPHENRDFSPSLTLAIRVAQERQAWAEEVAREEGDQALNYVGSKTIESAAHEVAESIRAKLGITTDALSAIGDPRKAFGLWRSRIESIGCFVFQVPGIDVKEMRGFALPNRFAPVIVVNIRDSFAARIFTMIHELSHIYLGETAVTGAGKFQFAPYTRNPTEKFCNRVAAATLVPAKELKLGVPDNWKQNGDDVIRDLAGKYKVSRAVILIRLFETGLADRGYVGRKFAAFNRPPKPKRRRAGGGPTRPQVILSRSGVAFSSLVVSAYQSGVIHGGELSSLLSMKMKHLAALEHRIFAGQQAGPP